MIQAIFKFLLNILATVGGCDPAIKVDLSYINVQG